MGDVWSASRPPWANSPRYLLDGRPSGFQSQSGRYGEEKNLLPLLEIEPRILGRPARSLVVVPSKLPGSSFFQISRLNFWMHFSSLPYLINSPFTSTWFHYSNITWRRIQITKLITKFSPYFCYLVSLRSKYSLWYSVLKHSFHLYRDESKR
jgi:hypothetical protein